MRDLLYPWRRLVTAAFFRAGPCRAPGCGRPAVDVGAGCARHHEMPPMWASDFTAAVDQRADCACGGALYVDEEREQRVGTLAIIRCTRCTWREGCLRTPGFGGRRPAVRGGWIVIEAQGRAADATRPSGRVA